MSQSQSLVRQESSHGVYCGFSRSAKEVEWDWKAAEQICKSCSAASQYKWDANAEMHKFKHVEDGSDEVIKNEWPVSQKLQEDSTEEASTPRKKRRFAESEPAKAKAKAKAKLTPEDSPCIDAAEVARNKTITLYRHSMGTADALVATVASDADWEWRREPNPLFAKLRSKMQRVKECTSHFAQRALLNNSMASQKRLLSKTEYFDSLTQMSASLDTELGELEGLCKRLSNMQEQCTKKT